MRVDVVHFYYSAAHFFMSYVTGMLALDPRFQSDSVLHRTMVQVCAHFMYAWIAMRLPFEYTGSVITHNMLYPLSPSIPFFPSFTPYAPSPTGGHVVAYYPISVEQRGRGAKQPPMGSAPGDGRVGDWYNVHLQAQDWLAVAGRAWLSSLPASFYLLLLMIGQTVGFRDSRPRLRFHMLSLAVRPAAVVSVC